MKRIEVQQLTKDYGNHKGVFHVNFSVEEGEVFGFLGPNGAGKTTTLRHLMGFIKPDCGRALIEGMDCFAKRKEIQQKLGYLPGEIALIDNITGIEFLNFIADMKGIKNRSKMQELITYFELDTKGKIHKMSKGMKQKIGIICTFMQSPEILLLDEPTSGLDPLMQNKFIDLINNEKKRGTTILLSSHIFEEVERTCNRVAFIRNGEIVTEQEMESVKQNRKRIFEITFSNKEEELTYLGSHPEAIKEQQHVCISVSGDADGLIKDLSYYTIKDISVRSLSLEELFLQYYKEGIYEYNTF